MPRRSASRVRRRNAATRCFPRSASGRSPRSSRRRRSPRLASSPSPARSRTWTRCRRRCDGLRASASRRCRSTRPPSARRSSAGRSPRRPDRPPTCRWRTPASTNTPNLPAREVFARVGPVLSDAAIAKTGHDLKFVTIAAAQQGVTFAGRRVRHHGRQLPDRRDAIEPLDRRPGHRTRRLPRGIGRGGHRQGREGRHAGRRARRGARHVRRRACRTAARHRLVARGRPPEGGPRRCLPGRSKRR